MARLDSSGEGFRGKKGGKVYYKVNGKTYAKEYTETVKGEPSLLQQFYFEKFRLVMAFLKPLKIPLEYGFQKFKVGMRTGLNVATSYVLNHGMNYVGDTCEVDPSKVLVSSGMLTGIDRGRMQWLTPDQVSIEWDDNSYIGNARKSDRAMALLYNPETLNSYYVLSGNFRFTGQQSVQVYDGEKEVGKLHGYLSFFKVSKKGVYEFSNSVYLGII
ncbi:DUF6266 family protein [Litoribacter populi]|uniref:DUF6266 family protein n=1 Tax=Litoribacter populi TaxID=2598460 RepID=UPI00117E05FC|nr:DUF6266 family protein [Litoribacter populi]